MRRSKPLSLWPPEVVRTSHTSIWSRLFFSHSRSSVIFSVGIQPCCHVPAGNSVLAENKTVKSFARGQERT